MRKGHCPLSNNDRRACEIVIDFASILFLARRRAVAFPQQLARLRSEAVNHAVAAAKDDLPPPGVVGKRRPARPLPLDDVRAWKVGLPHQLAGPLVQRDETGSLGSLGNEFPFPIRAISRDGKDEIADHKR